MGVRVVCTHTPMTNINSREIEGVVFSLELDEAALIVGTGWASMNQVFNVCEQVRLCARRLQSDATLRPTLTAVQPFAGDGEDFLL